MELSRSNSVLLMAAFVAAGLAWLNLHNEMAVLSGLTLLAIVFAYDEDAHRSVLQSLAFAAVCGMIFMVTLYPIHGWLSPTPEPTPGFFTRYLALLIWICAALANFLLDRARMGARDSFSLRQQQMAAPPADPAPFVPAPVHPVSVVNRVDTRPDSIIAVPQSASVLGTEPAPLGPASADAMPSTETTVSPAHAPQRPSQAVPPSPPVQTAPVPTGGKPATIYVNLVGEGMNMMRQIRAEHVRRDFYVIVEPMPVDEKWEFQTGQVVRCRKKNLSNGKGLVAYEEAPRAQ